MRRLLSLSFVFAGAAQAAATFDCLIEPTQTIELRSTVGGRIERIAARRGVFLEVPNPDSTIPAGIKCRATAPID